MRTKNDRAPAPWARRGPYRITMSQIYDSMNKPRPLRVPTLVPVGTAVAATVGDRLIRNACVIRTIGNALGRRSAAEGEFRAAGIPDWPSASMITQFDERAALPHRDDVLDHLGFRHDVKVIGGRERRVPAHRRTDAQHGVGARLARARSTGGQALGPSR